MKIALCLHGLSHGKNTLIDFQSLHIKCKDDAIPNTIDSFIKNIIDVNSSVDVFFHTWLFDINEVNTFVKRYSPKLYSFESPKPFNLFYDDELTSSWYSDFDEFHKSLLLPIVNYQPRAFSKMYSLYSVNFLKSTYEKMNNFKYDFVIHTRFDLQFNVPLILTNYNPEFIYIPNSKPFPLSFDDNWIFGNSPNMDIISELYHDIYKYLLTEGDEYKCFLRQHNLGVNFVCNHSVLTYHIIKNNLYSKIKMMFDLGKEWDIPKTKFNL